MIHLDYEYKKEGQTEWRECNQAAIIHMDHLKIKYEWRKRQETMKLKVIKVEPLPGNEYAPPLKMGDIHELKDITVDSKGNKHLDIGLKSIHNYIKSHETGENLPNGDKIYWCHPSRFEILKN